MPSNQTPNYQLSQWERTDKVLMEDFNADNAKIDGVLGTLAQSRNCQICYGSYVGTGENGASAPCKLTFSHKPVFLHIAGDRTRNFTAVRDNPYAVTHNTSGSSIAISVVWGENSVSWYAVSTPNFSDYSAHQHNDKGKTYYYCVLLEVQD